MPIVKILLNDRERDALIAMARQERRDPRAQAAMLIRHGLEQNRMLSPADAPTQERRAETKEVRHA